MNSGGGEVTKRKRASGKKQPKERKKQTIKQNYFVDQNLYQTGLDSDVSDADPVSDSDVFYSQSSDSSDEGNVATVKFDFIGAITRAKPNEKIPVAPEIAVTGTYIKFRTDGVYSFNYKDS